MANIGSLSVTLALESLAFTTGLGKSEQGVKKFAAQTLASVAMVTTAAEQVGGLAEGAFAWVKGGVDKVAEVGKEAERFGVSTEKLSALQFAAGREAGAWESALRHLSSQLGAAAFGGAEAGEAFARLGLDGRQLAGMGLDKAIDKIADRFAAIQDPAARAKLAQELFGRESAVLIPVLEKGASGLAEADAAAKKLGLSVSTVDAAKAIVAQRAMDDLGKSLEGIQRTFAVEFAPLIADAATGLTDMVAKAGGGKAVFKGMAAGATEFLVAVLKGGEGIAVEVADITGQIKDMVNESKKLKNILVAGVTPGGGLVPQSAWDTIKETFRPGSVVGGSAGAKTDLGKSVKDIIDPIIKGTESHGSKAAIDKVIADLEKLGKGGGAADDDALGKAKKLKDGIDGLTEKLNDQVAAFGKGAEAVERMKLAHEGATAAQLANVDAGIKQLDALKAQAEAVKEMDAQAKKVAEAAASPYDKLKSGFDEVSRLFAAGRIDASQYADALAKNFDSLHLLGEKTEHPGAALEGSKEAYETILHSQDQGRAGDVQQQIKSAIDRLVKVQERQEQLNQQMAEALTRIFVKN